MAKIEAEQTVTKTVIVGYRCDRCGKEDKEAINWVEMHHGHGGWGNDSCDSVEHFDLCSPKCYLEQLRESADDMRGYPASAEIDGKPLSFVLALLKHIEDIGHQCRLQYEP